VPAVFAMLLSTVPFLPAWAQWPLSNRVSRWVGDVSYGLFMFHFMTIFLVLKLLGINADGSPRALLELLVTVLPISLTIAWFTTRYIEKPARRWMRARADASEKRDRERTRGSSAPVLETRPHPVAQGQAASPS
jgi:peptidoglycan/LPS O-acetylase OafA/YrhL